MKNFLVLMLVTVPMLGMSSCAVLDFFTGTDSDESLVIGKGEDLYDDADYAVLPLEELPEEAVLALEEVLQTEEEDVLVLAEAQDFREGALYVAQSFGNAETGQADWMNVALGVGKIFFPGLAAWESILMFGSRRKKRHYGNALKKLSKPTPSNLGGAILDVVKAVGASHTSEDTKAVAEGDIVIEAEESEVITG